MSKENLLIKLMNEMVPDERPLCPYCLSPNLNMNDQFEIVCKDCERPIKPGNNLDFQRIYAEFVAQGLVLIIERMGFIQPDDLSRGLTKLENTLKKIMKKKPIPSDYSLSTLANLIRAGLRSKEGKHQPAIRQLVKARRKWEAGIDFARKEDLPVSALFDDVLALEMGKDEQSSPALALDFYAQAIEKAKRACEQAEESEKNAARQFLALQYLLEAIYWISLEELEAPELAQVMDEAFDIRFLEDDEAYEELFERLTERLEQFLSLLPGYLDNEVEEIVEPNLIEYLPDLVKWYEEAGDELEAEELEELSDILVRNYWEQHADQAALELLTDNHIAFFQNALETKQKEKALAYLDQWFKDWEDEKARDLLAAQMTVMLIYRMEIDVIYENFASRLLFSEMAEFMKKNVAYLNLLPKGESYYSLQFLKAQIAAKVALTAALARENKEVLEYLSLAVNTWKKLAEEYPDLIATSIDLGGDLKDLGYCYGYLLEEDYQSKKLEKIADAVEEIYALMRRFGNPAAREKAFFNEDFDLF